jgi:hypothetical protein
MRSAAEARYRWHGAGRGGVPRPDLELEGAIGPKRRGRPRCDQELPLLQKDRDLLGEPALADARLPNKQHELSCSIPHPLESVRDLFELCLPSDERYLGSNSACGILVVIAFPSAQSGRQSGTDSQT